MIFAMKHFCNTFSLSPYFFGFLVIQHFLGIFCEILLCGISRPQYKLDFSGLSGRSTSNARDEEGNSGMQGSDSKGSATSEASM